MTKLSKYFIAACLAFCGSALAGYSTDSYFGISVTDDVDYFVPGGASYSDNPYTVATKTYSYAGVDFSYSLAMGIHDVNTENSVDDTWYTGANTYGATSGSTSDGNANWNLDVYVNPYILGAEDISGTISYSATADSDAVWEEDIVFTIERSDLSLTFTDVFGVCNWLHVDANDSENPTVLLMSTTEYSTKDAGFYTIELNYGAWGFGVSNSIVVEVGGVPTVDPASPNVPVVPAPAAVLLSGLGTFIVGGIRRKTILS